MKTLLIVALTCMVGASVLAQNKLKQDLLPETESSSTYLEGDG